MDILKKIKTQLITGDASGFPRAGTPSVISLPIHLVIPNPNQPRRTFDHDLLKELSESIRQYGIIQPVTVRKKRDGTYELVAGERRLRAAALAGLLKVPAIITEMEDDDSAIVALMENIQRQNLSFLEEAQGYKSILEKCGYTQEQLAGKIGKTQSFVANKLRLLKLPQSVREVIRDSSLTERHARALLRIEGEQNQLSAALRIADMNLNVRQAEDLADKIRKKGASEVLTKKTPRSIADVRVFFKTISKAINIMNEKGIEATAKKDETDNYYEYTIRIHKGEEKSLL